MPTESIPRDVLVEVRGADFRRLGQVDDRDIDGLTVVSRRNNLGTWGLSLAADSAIAEELRVPGAGIVVSVDEEVLLSGPLMRARLQQKRGEVDTWAFEGVDDSWILGDRVAYPTPTTTDLTLQTGTSSSGYDIRTGAAETVMRAYVDANAGPSAPAARKLAVLDLAADQARGPSVTYSARFEPLGEILTHLAGLAGLNYGVRANGTRLLFEITARRDLSKLVRFDVADDTAEEAEYAFEVPGLTRALAGGKGEAAARTLVERSSVASRNAETLWGRRRERFIDRRNAEPAELEQSGDEAIAEEGKTRVGLSITPVDTPRARFWTDWRLGDLVSATVRDVEIVDVVGQTTVTYGKDGLSVSAVLGDPDVAAAKPILRLLSEQRRLRARTGRLERK